MQIVIELEKYRSNGIPDWLIVAKDKGYRFELERCNTRKEADKRLVYWEGLRAELEARRNEGKGIPKAAINH